MGIWGRHTNNLGLFGEEPVRTEGKYRIAVYRKGSLSGYVKRVSKKKFATTSDIKCSKGYDDCGELYDDISTLNNLSGGWYTFKEIEQ